MELKYGYSFYPEHCSSKEELYRDIEIIKNSGANVVRMGEFCWDQLEPSDGEYNIEIIKEAVDILGNNGISSIICTPTSCPPSWLYSKYPEIAYIDYRGVKRPFGSRHSYCYNNEIYRKYSKRIVEMLGEVLGNNDNVIGFQIGNEFAQEGSGRCHCKVCTEKFRKYLEKKYETVQNLNQKCGTYFWGLSFNDFSHITPPATTTENGAAPLFPAYFDNPGIRINFERFSSDSMKEFSDIQIDTLKRFTDKPISSNSTSFATNLIDYYDFYEKADLYALDIYPELFYGEKDNAEFSYSFARNLKKTDFWILEFAIGGGHGLWAGEGRLQPYPGAIPLHVMHAFANGASLITHFQYKTFRSGAEQLNYALLDADRVPRRKYFDFQETANLLKKHEQILLSSSCAAAEIAIVLDYDALWSLKIKPVHHDFDYISYIQEIHTALRSKGYSADIISKHEISDKYKMIIVPALFVSDTETCDALHSYVEGGGCLVSSFLTSVKDMNNVAYDSGLPGNLQDLFGIEIYEVEPVFDASTAQIEISLPSEKLTSENKYWLDEITLKGADAIGVFRNTYRKGHCAVSENHYGSGTAYYYGTGMETDAFAQFLDALAQSTQIKKPDFDVPKGISVVERRSESNTYYYIFNFNKSTSVIDFPVQVKDAVSGKNLGNSITLNEFGFICVTL